jgi:hypothetical protein
MAWFAAAIPYITGAATAVSTGATLAQAAGQRKVAEYNAQASELEAKAAFAEAGREEEAQRRETAAFLGKQRAAIAEAGLGTGGTTGMLADQSAVLAELDALNIRYQGMLRGAGLLSEATTTRYGGRQIARSAGLLAGQQLLAGAAQTGRAYAISKGI